MKRWDLAIIGGGAAGLTAAVTAARAGLSVCVIDHMDRVGKKLLSTGNGRCNFTNAFLSPDCYYTHSPEALSSYLSAHGTEEILSFMESIGIEPLNRGGYFYPASQQAASVVDCLLAECGHLHVDFLLSQTVTSLKKTPAGFTVRTKEGTLAADSVLLSCGGKSAAHSGSDGSGYGLAGQLGHGCRPLFPSLVPLQIEKKRFQSLSGTRCQVRACLSVDENLVRGESGELQWNEECLSGIVIFQMSHPAIEALRQHRKVAVILNFLPALLTEECFHMLKARQTAVGYKELYAWGIGLLPKKLWEFLIRESGLPIHQKASALTDRELSGLQRLLQAFPVPVSGALGYDRAQVTAGGIDLSEIHLDTMESRRTPGLYLAGEMLDVDGICGGYNLHWAITGGITAGRAIAEKAKAGKEGKNV